MFKKGFAWGIVVTVIVVLGYWGVSSGAKGSGKQTCTQVPAETVADYVHAALQADRTFYTTHVVERMQAKGIVIASENWQETNTLPLPAQFLNESNRLVGSTRTGIGYRLISLWPINKRSGPDTFLQAVYADRAVSQACIGCHNTHPDSPKRDFKLNDVIGGMIITVPLKNQ